MRDRVLTKEKPDGKHDDREIAWLWHAADVEAYPLGPMIKLLLLTGCREMEIGALAWDEIQGDEIVLEGERTKNGEPHHVPLSPQAKAILASVPRISGCPYVFTVTGEGPFTSWSCGKHRLDKTMRKLAIEGDAKTPAPWRIHDLRRTCATLLERLGTPLQITEAYLNHSGSKKGLVGRHQRRKYHAEKRQAAKLLGAEIKRIVHGPAKVLPIKRAA